MYGGFMLATIALAALMFPTPGKYLCTYTTATGAQIAADVWIYATSQGFVTHEERRHFTPIATTDQHFDHSLLPNWYLGAKERREQLFIRVWKSFFEGDGAQVMAADKATRILFHYPSGCVLIHDDGLTSRVMLPSVVRVSGARTCTFVTTNGAMLTATIDTAQTRRRPKEAEKGDLALTVKIGSLTETLWYDPQTMIPDYIDLGPNGNAKLMATTGEQ